MKEFPQNIRFKYNWRRYQKRILEELEEHLDDNHLHIIAPPGSGKTVLGLEVALRLNKPTLILAPTVAIRNQWIQRFCELFLQVKQKPDWISRDIKNPKFLTVTTYQGLHAACTNNKTSDVEPEDELDYTGKTKKNIDATHIVKLLKAQEVETIVVDEAHHLKNEWWKSLNAVKNALNPTVVGLTATPPYDVSMSEWQRYIELNGSIDTEISVPELVVENDLCPHQDFVYLSKPTEKENKLITDQRSKALKVFEELKKDDTLINAIMNHSIFQYPSNNLEWIYNNIECYSATLIFLNSVGKIITKKHLDIIGDKKFKIPPLDYEWFEILLKFYLFKDQDNFVAYNEHREKLINKLKHNGLIERKKISFRYNQKINSYLSSSLSKLQSIDNIVDIEHNTLGNNLRMVILTDYIRKEFMTKEPSNNLELNKIGVLPIFEQLRRTNDRNMKLGILSGSLIIIPSSALPAFNVAANKLQIENISYTSLSYDSQYVIINTNEKLKHDIVQLVTQIFEDGEIEVLIGTKSLLGEGWDAPTINSLILASFVGSYVLSNQMRGRAIRSSKENPNKTGNIWHLICVDNTSPDGGEDIKLLKRRFKSFVGISSDDDVSIENGINRIKLPNTFEDNNIEAYNNITFKSAGQRNLLKQKWEDALSNGVSMIEQIKVPFTEEEDYQGLKTLYYNKTIANLIATLASGIATYAISVLRELGESFIYIDSKKDLYSWLLIFGIGGFLLFGSLFYRTLRLFIKYRDISKDIQQIGDALLKSLIKLGTIQTETSKLQIVSSVNSEGEIFCHLEGGTNYEKSIFIKSLQEIISSIDNPRYLIIRKNQFLKIISQKDYHSVPEFIGRNKKTAEYFENQWRKFVGSCDLVYTRTIEGRKTLLRSRISSLSSEFEDKIERINKWR